MNKADLVREWLNIASVDLLAATHLFKTMQPKPLEIICYQCQQAVEKVLKAFLINQEIEPPYIHDLEKLRLMCVEYNASFEKIQEVSLKLRGYSASTRYPNRPEIGEADAVYALQEADKTYAFCTSLIPSLQLTEQEQELKRSQTQEQTM